MGVTKEKMEERTALKLTELEVAARKDLSKDNAQNKTGG